LTLSINTILIFCGPHLPSWYSSNLGWEKGLTLIDRIHMEPLHWPQGWVGPIPHLYIGVRELARLLDPTIEIGQDRHHRDHVTSWTCTDINIILGRENGFPRAMWHNPNGVAWYKVKGPKPLSFHVTVVYGLAIPSPHATPMSHATMAVHVTSTMSILPRGLHVMLAWCTIKYPKFCKFWIFPELYDFNNFTKVAMEPKIKLANGQFRPRVYRLNHCSQNSTLLCWTLN
jgi:hypothetical protein